MSVELSVVVPVHGGASLLEQCLDAVRRSDFTDCECIVVDDGSPQDIRAIAERYGAHVLRLEQRGGPARARNRGAAMARGEVLVFIDADVRLHPDALGRMAAHLRRHPSAAALIGSYDDAPAEPHFVSQFKNLFHHYVHQSSRREAWTFWTGCGAVRRQEFLAAGGFDESYARPSIEDIDLGFRLRARGLRIDLDPEVQVTHLKRWTLAGLVRTDVCDRGVPWLLLMLRHRTMPADLNLRRAHRASVALAWAALLLVAAALGGPAGWRAAAGTLAALCAAALVLLNLDLYRFFVRKRGLAFALRALPLHWLYYAYCGLAVAIALPLHLWHKAAGR